MILRISISMIVIAGCVAFYKYVLGPLILLQPESWLTVTVNILFVLTTLLWGMLIILGYPQNKKAK